MGRRSHSMPLRFAALRNDEWSLERCAENHAVRRFTLVGRLERHNSFVVTGASYRVSGHCLKIINEKRLFPHPAAQKPARN